MRYLKFSQLETDKGISFCRMHIDRLEKAGKFPRRVKISDRAVGWIEAEIDAWQKAKADQRQQAAA